jgi:hypothetical protein
MNEHAQFVVLKSLHPVSVGGKAVTGSGKTETNSAFEQRFCR